MGKNERDGGIGEIEKNEAAETAAKGPAPNTGAETEDAAGEIAAELLECKDRLLRMAAEYDNFRKRSARERDAVYAAVKADTVGIFLPILDNLDRAAAAPCSDSAYLQGVALIARQFYEILAKAGVSEIEALNKPFDSNLHNAVMHVDQEGVPASCVVEVFQKGYIMGDRVIRHSVVKVAN